ncbi:putative alpha/beta hydrolase [Blattamonas nauphoetae]|uniref:Alpha/beta hydrolase n=1 Tax=Blattamonas nauphoetae TaxID=2049346 RepID=A0ABQ9XZJ0_9EUKA|nr:putative alpha/beta hydrolase [Blattamonas nauphoetae]
MTKTIRFVCRDHEVAADLRVPPNFSDAQKYPAIIIVHPGSSCKEQTAGIYGEKLAKNGFVTLAINASYQGESGGEPRNIEDPASRMEDIRSAIDYLQVQPFVDAEKIGAVGVCAGGGYVINVALTEKRLKAIGTCAAADVGSIYRGPDPAGTIALLENIAKQRTAEVKGAEPMIVPWHKNSDNKLRFVSMANMMAFDALNFVDTLLSQPIQIIIGDKPGAFGSMNLGRKLFELATASKEKDLLVIEGACHYDLYDDPKTTDIASAKLSDFFHKHL